MAEIDERLGCRSRIQYTQPCCSLFDQYKRNETYNQPGTLSPCNGLVSAIPISVMPYLSSNLCPVILSHSSKIGWGKAAEPETINLEKVRETTFQSLHVHFS